MTRPQFCKTSLWIRIIDCMKQKLEPFCKSVTGIIIGVENAFVTAVGQLLCTLLPVTQVTNL